MKWFESIPVQTPHSVYPQFSPAAPHNFRDALTVHATAPWDIDSDLRRLT